MIEHPCGAVAVSATGRGPVRVPFRLCCVAALFAGGDGGDVPRACVLGRTVARPEAQLTRQRDDLGRAA